MGTYSIFLILIVLVAFLLVLVIMVQNPKGGGLSSSFGGGGTQQLGGVKQTTDFLDKSTLTLVCFPPHFFSGSIARLGHTLSPKHNYLNVIAEVLKANHER